MERVLFKEYSDILGNMLVCFLTRVDDEEININFLLVCSMLRHLCVMCNVM